MKKLTTADSIVTINHYKNILEAEGIRCEIRNQHLGSIVGEMPFPEVWPQLWVKNDLDYDRAKELLAEDAAAEHAGEPWRCPKCREENEGQFAACWNCGHTL